MINNQIPIHVFYGPTATGKTKIAIEFCLNHKNCVLINADAFQIYSEMQIGTTRDEKELSVVEHLLFGHKSINDEYSVAVYQKECRQAIEDTLKANKTPVLVGGSNLFLASVLYNFQFSLKRNNLLENDFELLKAKIIEKSPNYKFDQSVNLKKLQLIYSKLIENKEVKSNSFQEPWYAKIELHYVDVTDKQKHADTIYCRLLQMLKDGWIKEVESIVKTHKNFWELNASKALGYKFIYENKDLSDKQLAEHLTITTLQIAKKQRTYFKKFKL